MSTRGRPRLYDIIGDTAGYQDPMGTAVYGVDDRSNDRSRAPLVACITNLETLDSIERLIVRLGRSGIRYVLNLLGAFRGVPNSVDKATVVFINPVTPGGRRLMSWPGTCHRTR